MANIIKNLKKHLESTKLIEKQNAAFQQVLQERNFFRANSLALAEENEELKKRLGQMKFKIKNLEIDNGNYKTFLYKNREAEVKDEMERQKHTFKILDKITNQQLNKVNIDYDVEKPREVSYNSKTSKNHKEIDFDAKRMFKANWQVFKNKNAFADNIYNTIKDRTIVSGYSSYGKIKFKKISNGGSAKGPFNVKNNKFRLKSCCPKKNMNDQTIVNKRNKKNVFAKESFKLNKDYTLSYLLRQ